MIIRALITGAGGQDSWYLQQLLRSLDIEFRLIDRKPPFNDISLDVPDQVAKCVKEFSPTHVFHFAAKSSTRHQFLFDNHAALVKGTTCLLEACRLHSPGARVFLSGSGLQFENKGLPIAENSPFAVESAYACARVQSVYLGRYFRAHFGLPVFVGYLFGHESPRRPKMFTSKMLVDAALSARKDSDYRCEVGNISVRREFGYAADIVLGIWRLVNQPIGPSTIWEANICTGVGISLEQWAQIAFDVVGLRWQDFVFESKDFAPDYKSLVGLRGRISELGWSPSINSLTLCRLMLGVDDERRALNSLFQCVRVFE